MGPSWVRPWCQKGTPKVHGQGAKGNISGSTKPPPNATPKHQRARALNGDARGRHRRWCGEHRPVQTPDMPRAAVRIKARKSDVLPPPPLGPHRHKRRPSSAFLGRRPRGGGRPTNAYRTASAPRRRHDVTRRRRTATRRRRDTTRRRRDTTRRRRHGDATETRRRQTTATAARRRCDATRRRRDATTTQRDGDAKRRRCDAFVRRRLRRDGDGDAMRRDGGDRDTPQPRRDRDATRRNATRATETR